ncbi:MAG: ACT domain-containing protein, partial [Anaerolineae bacterium]
ERLFNVTWGQAARQVYPVSIRVRAFNRGGLLRDVAAVVADEGIDMSAAQATVDQKENLAYITATLQVASASQLSKVLAKIERIPNVIEAVRVKA